MKSFIFIFVTLVLFSVKTNAESSSHPIEVVPFRDVVISEVVIEEIDNQNLLTGEIKRARYNSQVVGGHIDYALVDAQNNILDQGAVQYSPSLSLRKWKYGSSFSIALPAHLPENTKIKITYHRDSLPQRTASLPANHEKNSLL